MGIHSIVMAKYFNKVYSFEPQPNIYQLLNKNIKLNNIKNIDTFNVALGNKNSKDKSKGYEIVGGNTKKIINLKRRRIVKKKD